MPKQSMLVLAVGAARTAFEMVGGVRSSPVALEAQPFKGQAREEGMDVLRVRRAAGMQAG